MHPIGKLPVKFVLGNSLIIEEFHIYANVIVTIISWRIAKYLGILPPHYPQPISPEEPFVVTHAKLTSLSDLRGDYSFVFGGVVKTMEGELLSYSLSRGCKTFCVQTPWTILYAFQDKLKAELQLQEQNMIAMVNKPTEWCFPIVVALKKGTDKIRLSVDLTHLNNYIRCERYQCPTPAQAVADIAAENAKIFTKFDALKGYH